jgi:hypothetical protein
MKRFALTLCMLPFLYLATGCSSKLTRSEVTHKINAKLKQLSPRSGLFVTKLMIPGYGLPDGDLADVYFTMGRQATDSGLSLESALAKLGYVTIQDGGPGEIPIFSIKHHFDSTRIVTLTGRVGKVVKKDEHYESYESGFECHPDPYPPQCTLPLVEMGNDFEITGITQDEIHAKVDILIPWKLTPLALALKPLAKADESKPNVLGDPWQRVLNSRSESGSSEATIFFQKFDDGWRITDVNGNS